MNRPRKKDRHLPRCVYLKHNAYWLVRKGKWHRLGDDLHAALTAYAAIYETPKGGTAELIEEAFLAIKPNLKASTVKQYAQAAGKLKKMLAEFSPEQVQPVHAARIKKAMAKTPNMANRVLSFARQVFDYALEEERVTINPFVGIRRHQEAKRTRLVTAEEFAAIYAKAGPRLQVVLELLRLTGQRITAVLRIRRSDLVEDGIRFPHHKTDTKRIVKWTPELREAVERAKTLNGNIRALTLLHNRRGKAPDYSTVKIQWNKAKAAAQVEDVTLHDLRALAATEAKKQGKNATELLGHTSEQQTRRYLRGKEEPVVEGPSFRRPIDNTNKS
jgi:integrase